MIQLTRLNGKRFVLNAERIRFVESTPDTLLSLDSGGKLMVKESVEQVVERAIVYARAIRTLAA